MEVGVPQSVHLLTTVASSTAVFLTAVPAEHIPRQRKGQRQIAAALHSRNHHGVRDLSRLNSANHRPFQIFLTNDIRKIQCVKYEKPKLQIIHTSKGDSAQARSKGSA